MLWHLGLLSDDPSLATRRGDLSCRHWFRPDFPAELREEIAVWLAMPGIDSKWHIRNLGVSWNGLTAARSRLPSYRDLEARVVENWLSATREDCIRLCRMRFSKLSTPPLLSQLGILDDLKAGKSVISLATEYRVSRRYIDHLKRRGPDPGRVDWPL